MELMKKTSLEKSDNVNDTLEWKLQRIQDANLPTESGIADYIALAIQNIEKEVDYVKEMEKQYKAEKDLLQQQIEMIKVEGAKFFNNNGIVKIEGIICSSITVTKQKEAETTQNIKKVFTPLISEQEIQDLLIGLGKAEMKTITEEVTTNAVASKLKVNKKKKA